MLEPTVSFLQKRSCSCQQGRRIGWWDRGWFLGHLLEPGFPELCQPQAFGSSPRSAGRVGDAGEMWGWCVEPECPPMASLLRRRQQRPRVKHRPEDNEEDELSFANFDLPVTMSVFGNGSFPWKNSLPRPDRIAPGRQIYQFRTPHTVLTPRQIKTVPSFTVDGASLITRLF